MKVAVAQVGSVLFNTASRQLRVKRLCRLAAGSISGEGLLFAEIDPDDIKRGKFDLEVTGHFNRPDLLHFHARQK